jgi:hypothetical protein
MSSSENGIAKKARLASNESIIERARSLLVYLFSAEKLQTRWKTARKNK